MALIDRRSADEFGFIRATRDTLKKQGLNITSQGMSVKTAKTYDQERYFDDTQKYVSGLSSLIPPLCHYAVLSPLLSVYPRPRTRSTRRAHRALRLIRCIIGNSSTSSKLRHMAHRRTNNPLPTIPHIPMPHPRCQV